jgi:hypothetical protein
VISVFLLLVVLPERIRIFPSWALLMTALFVLTPLALMSLSSAKSRWHRVETLATLTFAVFFVVLNQIYVSELVWAATGHLRDVSGLALLSSAIGVWWVNVVMFSLIYWQLDRGGPSVRSLVSQRPPDWIFPEDEALGAGILPSWRPTYIDYLFLFFSTATSLSSADIPPLTRRAKVLMMVEAIISLATLALVGARALNMFGS